MLIIVAVEAAFALSRMGAGNRPLPVIGRISDFNLTNQNNEPVTLANLRGKVWLANIVFTRCPGPCATMTRHLAELQSALPKNEPIRLVTFTSDPEYDTPAVFKKYAGLFGADTNQWWFLTGNKPELRSLAVNDFKFVVVEKKPEDRTVPDDLFIHSIWYVLVDQKGQVRGWTDREGRLHAYFDSADADARAEILPAIKQLLNEPPAS